MATLENQLEWEQEHRRLGQAKIAAQLEAAKEGGRATDTPLGMVVLRRHLLKLSESIAKDLTTALGEAGRSKAYVPLLASLDVDSVALIALSETVDMLMSVEEKSTTQVAHAIGRTLYGELVLASFRDMKEDLYETLVNDLQHKMSKDLRHRLTIFRMQAKQAGIELPEWSRVQKIQVGMYLLGLMGTDEENGLQLVETYLKTTSDKKTQYHTQLTPEVMRMVGGVEHMLHNKAGFAAPCLIPPQPWTGVQGEGGYHGDLKIRAVRFFKGTGYQWDVMEAEGHDPTTTLRMLNKHQRVAWAVNPYILSVLRKMRIQGKSIPKKVEFTSTHEKLRPKRLEFLDTADTDNLTDAQATSFKAWKGEMRDWHTKARQVGRVEMRLNYTILAAEAVEHLEQFYYVYQVDYRGRMYPVSGALNPQGNDVSKALLRAARGLPITDARALWWFKLSIAAKFGIDKLAADDCVRWVDENHHNIIRCASDPLESDAFKWWSGADKPLQFLAVCDEYARWSADPVGFESRIAVAMDGSCNGLQNYSAMCRDEVGGRATNLLPTEDGRPNDIYKDVAGAAWARLSRMEASNHKLSWQQVGFDRSLTKKSVMTQVYGSTFGTCRKSIMAYCEDKGLFPGEEYEHAEYAAKLVWSGIGDVVVKAREAMDWLRSSCSLVMKEGAEYLSWLTPTGFRVVQVYDKYDTIRVRTHIGKKVFLRVLDTNKPMGPDKMRHRNAFPPNVIHGTDSGHMAFVTEGMEDEDYDCFLHFVHDDFGALPALADVLSRVIREQFVKMHKSYSLDAIRTEYPFINPPPAMGDLDINQVLHSINFFR